MDWPTSYMTFISSIAVLGLWMGSFVCDKFLPLGRLNVIHLANILVVVSVVPQMFLNLYL